MGIFKELWDMGKELGTILKEGKEELDEILTDGFVEIVVKGNSEYKTSFEKNDIASSIIFHARVNYEKKLEQIEAEIDAVDKKIKSQQNRKMKLANKLSFETQKSLDNFENYDLANYIVDKNDKNQDLISSITTSVTSISNFSISNAKGFGGISVMGKSILVSALEKRNRVMAANESLDEAHSYRNRVSLEINNLDLLLTKIEYIRKLIDEEANLVNLLTERLNALVTKLDSYVGLTNVTEEMANEAFELFKMTKLMSEFVNTNFFDYNCDVTENYLIMVEKIRSEVR